MATLSLKISMDGGKVVKTIQLEPSTTVQDACRVIREKILEAGTGDPKDYGLFLASEEDSKKGIWLEPVRTLDYYMLRNGDLLEYARKTRNLRVKMLDGTVKTILVDDSQLVANLMVVICSKIGITNHDEYGLVREECKEEPDPCEKPNYGTLTLRRKHHDKERDAKMENLRKKLRTDDEVNWVEGSKTLREQGVEWSETLLLRRRLFFSDRNVDGRDPVQLNLLYVQAQHAILHQHHPVTADKACEFAGIQCQIQFGDHKEDKHVAGFLDLKEFLPESYAKVKGIEKKIFKEHKKHVGLSELDAKVLYTKTARDLKTYGVAFFLVKEKMKGKNKLVPRLLGITKDSVLRLDEKTKEILQTWPLTTVRRWCASPNTFTLDFGDYSDQYYSVQTLEPDQIQSVLAGYIDMIVRRQRAKDHVGIHGDQGAAMLEDTVSPNKANIIQHDTFKSGKVSTESVAKPAVMRPGPEGAKSFALGHHTSAQQTTISGQIVTGYAPPAASQAQQTRVTSLTTEPQRALLSTISSGREVIKHTEETLTRAQIPDAEASSARWRSSTMESSRQAVTSHIAAMNAATAQVVTLTSGTTEEVDHTAVGAAITTITTNLPEMTKGVQMIAALMEDNDNGERLLDATRKLCSAFSDLLKAAEPDTKEPRQNLLNAASRVGEASTSVLHTIGDELPEDKETQDILLSLAKAVANTTAALVLKAKHVAAQCKDEQQLQTNIIACATNAALATSQLVACAKVVAPTLHNPACREQITSAARLVAQSVERLVAACEPVQDKEGVQQLTDAARRVAAELERLLAHCEIDGRAAHAAERAVESVLAAGAQLAAAGDAGDMLRHARLLGQATAHLITTIKTEAESQPSDSQRRLLAAAKLLADATTKLVEAARQCASQPQDSEKQEALRQAAEELRFITTDYGHTRDVVGSQIARLRESAKNTASCATQLATSAQSAAQYNTNKYTQETLDEECRKLWEQVGSSVDAIRSSTSHLQLINTSTNLLRSSNLAIQASRAALPSISDAAANKHLSDTTLHLADACSDLRSAVSRARVATKGTELDATMQLIASLQHELEEFLAAHDNALMPGQNAEWCSERLAACARGAASCSSQLAACARQQDAGGCAQATVDLAHHLTQYSAAARVDVLLAAADPPRRDRIVTCCREVLQSSYTLVETVKRYIVHGETQQLPNIVALAKEMTQGMERTLEATPSQEELDAALDVVNDTLDVLDMGEFPHTDRPYGELQSSLTSAAASLNAAASSVAASCAGADATTFSDRFSTLTHTAMEIAGRTQDLEVRSEMVTSMKSVTINSSKLLSTVKSASQDSTRPNAKNQLMAAARAVTDSINRLVDVCTEAAPGQKECSAAIRRIESARGLLGRGHQPVNELGYCACVDAVVDASRQLSEGMSGLAQAARGGDSQGWSRAPAALADAAAALAECAAQAAYLVGVSDASSVAGRVGLVDQAQLSRAADHIQQACQLLCEPTTQQHQVVSAATAIAKHTSALCDACRAASARSTEPRVKRHFVQAAKDVATCTALLVKQIKALDNNYTEEDRARFAESSGALVDAVSALVQFADRAEFASLPAKISAQAQLAQRPILHAGQDILSGAISMLEAGRALALAPNERSHWHELATHSKTVSDCIKTLVTHIREKAPGQKECEDALELIKQQQRILDQAALQAAQKTLPPNTKYTLQGYCSQLESSCGEMLERLEPVRAAATEHVENLGHAVTHLVSYLEPLIRSSVGALSHITDGSLSAQLADRTTTVLESISMLVGQAAQAARASSSSGDVSAQMSLSHTAVSELSALSRELSTQAGGVGPLLDSISKATLRLTHHRMSLIGSYDESETFVQYQTRMVAAAKEIARLANDMTAKSVTEPSSLVAVGSDLCSHYEKLAADALGASATAANTDLATRIRTSVSELGDAVSVLVTAGGRCRLSADQHNKTSVASAADTVNEKVVGVVAALQSGGGGTQACIDACATLAALISDLDTTILFASAGTLHSELPGDQFGAHREGILQTAKLLVEHTKALVGGCSSQQGLAAAAHVAVGTVLALCEVVKQGAASLGSGSPEPQVLVLLAARDVTAALRDLVAATAAAAGKPMTHPDMERLKHAAKVMVTNVTSLLKTVKAVEDEHTRGTRALESTIEAISQEIEFLHSATASDGPSAPEELIRRTRQMTLATAKAVAAGNSGKQDSLVAAANLGRKTVVDLLRACKACAYAADSADLQDKTIIAGESAALTYKQLLQAVLEGHKNKLPDLSRHVAKAVQEIIAAGEQLKGSEWVDPADPAVVAETELLAAAATIDAAANKLASLRPRKTLHHETDESLNFDEMILEAAKCIISATSALVRAASSAQRELIDQGKVARRPAQSSDDGQWSEGLVSAARLVAAAAHSLVDAANALVQGVGSEERLVSAARSVAAGTAQLLVACKVKADPAAESTRRLQSAGAEVIRSTDNLVRAARDAVARDDERSLVLNRRMVGGIAQEIDARSEVLRIEKELDEARGRLAAIRQAKYKLKTESGDETDTDVSVTGNRQSQRYKSPTSSFANTTYTPNSTISPHNTHNNTTLNSTLNSTNLSHNISQLNQSIHGLPTSQYDNTPKYTQSTVNFNQNTANYGQNPPNYGQNPANYGQNPANYGQNPANYGQNSTNYSQTQNAESQNGYDKFTKVDEKQYTVSSPSFSSFRPHEDTPKQNYEGFTTRYETRLYDTPRPTTDYSSTEEKRHSESSQYFSKQEQKFAYDTPKVATPLSPKFNARELKFESEPIYSSLKKPTTPKSPLDGVGQTFSEHKKSTEKIPGGTIQSEYSIKSESYQSHPKSEYSKTESRHEVKSPFTTSTPAKDFTQYEFGKSTDLVKAATPDYDRIASPYGKDVYSYGGPNFKEETTTEVKEIPNGTQKITTTKIYSSSPVNLTSTSTKYEPMPKLDGIDELSKSFDNDSKYSTLDSRFNTLDSKLSSDTSRSFMRPSEFQSSDYQTTSNVTKVMKPSDLTKEIDVIGNKFSKQTITSETIERKSVMTSSHKSEKSSTVTKKFGNY